MPAAESKASGRVSGRLLTGLFWAGVGLAPLAALLLLIGSGSGLLRVAAVLALLAVVLIGLSITLRREGDNVRAEVEDLIFDEVDALRDDVREDIAHAARATHKSIGEKLVGLNESVEALRGQVEALRSQVNRPPTPAPAPAVQAAAPPRVARAAAHAPPPPGPRHVAGGVLRHTETVQVTTRQTMLVDHNDQSGVGTVYGGHGGEYSASARAEVPRVPTQRRADRHADTGGGPHEESWTEQLLRERLARQAPEDDGPTRGFDRDGHHRDGHHRDGHRRDGHQRDEDQRDEHRRDEHRREDQHRDEHRRDDHDDRNRVSGLRTTDRWASMRADDRGRELRMGERRAAVHSDGSGTEMRIEDRWASVRREDTRRDGPRHDASRGDDLRHDASRRDDSRHDEEPRRSAPRRDLDSGRHQDRDRADAPWSEKTWEGARGGVDEPSGRWAAIRREPRGTQAALPAAASEPLSNWTSSWAADRDAARDAARDNARDAARDGVRHGSARESESHGPARDAGHGGGTRDRSPRAPYESGGGARHGHGAREETTDPRHAFGGRAEPTGSRSVERATDLPSRRSRHASADEDDDYGWNGGRDTEPRGRASRGRLVDFEVTDDRWR